MSDKVVPIRSAGFAPTSTIPPKKSRARRAKKTGLLLRESDKNEGFSTLEVLSGLHAVCLALEEIEPCDSADLRRYSELSVAAKVLSTILSNRVDSDF